MTMSFFATTTTTKDSFNYTTASSADIPRPVVPDDSNTLSDLLSRELLKLSLSDRTAIHEEIHGVRCLAVRETSELIYVALIEFQTELDRISPKDKQAYEECKMRMMLFPDEERTCYILNNDDFRIRFLRCELFNAKEAARKFVNYLNFVRELWGPEIVLKRLIQCTDFTKSEMKLLRKGYFQVLPFRDRSGRRVVTILGGLSPEIDPIERSKVLFYIVDVLTRNDVESQRKGIILITEGYMWSSDENGTDGQPVRRSNDSLRFPNPQESPFYIRKLITSMPARLVAAHNIWPDRPAFKIIAKILTVHGLTGSTTQSIRWKFHIGNELEMRYRLKSYGIPIELLPITESGTIKYNHHQQWMKTRKLLEQQVALDGANNIVIVECPGSNDVIFRRGTSSMENPGNNMYRDMILTYLEGKEEQERQNHFHEPGVELVPSVMMMPTTKTITTASTTHTIMIDWLLDQITNHKHGRILDWSKKHNTWIQMSDEIEIKKKISALLYTCERIHHRCYVSRGVSTSSNTARSKQHLPSSSSTLSSSLLTIDIKLKEEEVYDNNDGGDDDDNDTVDDTNVFGPYSFVEGGRPSSSKQQRCCRISSTTDSSSFGGKKRLRMN